MLDAKFCAGTPGNSQKMRVVDLVYWWKYNYCVQRHLSTGSSHISAIPPEQYLLYELWHEISSNVVYATSQASDQPAHTRSLIRAFASCLNIATDRTPFGVSQLKRRLQRLL